MAVTASWVLGKHLDDWEWHQDLSSSSTRDRKKSKKYKFFHRWDPLHLTSEVCYVNAYV